MAPRNSGSNARAGSPSSETSPSASSIFLPAALVLSVMTALALLALRAGKIPTAPLWFTFGGLLLAAALISWLRARRKFFSIANALVRLDEIGRLHNRLTAANEGIGGWPPPRQLREPTRWNWPRVCAPISFASALLIAAVWVPISLPQKSAYAKEPPLAWNQIDSWLQVLEQAKIVEPEALKKLREQLDDLRQKPDDEWYKQSSLEAGDNLRQQTQNSLRALQRDLEKSEQALSAAEQTRATLPPNELKNLSDSLQKSVQGLELGNLPLNKELLREMKTFDASKMQQLSQSQLAALRDKIKAGEKVCQQCIGVDPNLKKSGLLAEQPAGGPGGGGSPAPLALKEEQTNLRSKKTDTLSNKDPSRASPGDVFGVSKSEHDVKKSEALDPIAGGAISSIGQGGEAVWRDRLTPREREILQRYFK